MAFTEEEEQALRGIIAIYRSQAPSLSEDLAAAAPALYPDWDGDGHAYTEDERVYHDGQLWFCTLGHTSQADWEPGAATGLWSKVLDAGGADTPVDEIPEWVQPGPENGYAKGVRVRHNGKVWESTFDGANVWEPGVTGTEALWKEVSE